jgi:hypothetical protein
MDNETTDADKKLLITIDGRVFRFSLKRFEEAEIRFLKTCCKINYEIEEDPIVDVLESGVFPDD